MMVFEIRNLIVYKTKYDSALYEKILSHMLQIKDSSFYTYIYFTLYVFHYICGFHFENCNSCIVITLIVSYILSLRNYINFIEISYDNQ